MDLDTHEIVAWFGAVALAHGVEGHVIDIVEESLVPLVNMTAEDCTDIPLVKLIEQEIGFFTGEGRGKLQLRRQEDIGMAEDECVTVVILTVEQAFFYQFHLMLAQRAAGSTKEDKVVANLIPVLIISAIDIKLIE